MKERMNDIELPSDKSVIKNIRTQQKARIAEENKELFEDEKERRKREFAKKFKPRDRDKDQER